MVGLRDGDVMTYVPGYSSPAEWLPGTPAAWTDGSVARWREDLRRVVADEIVPRLRVRRHCDGGNRVPITATDVAAFANLSLTESVGVLLAHTQTMALGGVGLERVIMDLLAPAARYLGDLWLADRLSFVAVTRGTSALQALMRTLGPSFEQSRSRVTSARSILLAPVAGEQHVFGLSILSSFFRRAGWQVTFDPGSEDSHTTTRLASRRFDAVGLSASGTRYAARVPDLVERIRRVSANPDVVVLVGGGTVVERPDLVAEIKADAVLCDAPRAVRAATSLVSACATRP